MGTTGYAGTFHRAIQTGYADQPLQGFPGQLATALYPYVIGHYPTDGIVFVGTGVAKGDALTVPATAEYYNIDAPRKVIAPTAVTTAAMFEGIVIRDESADNNSDGIPIIRDESVAPVLREGFMYVAANVTVAADEPVYWIVQDSTSHGFDIGTFSNADQGGDAVLLARATWHAAASAGDVAIIELLLK